LMSRRIVGFMAAAPKRLAIIGAGPSGLELAMGACQRGLQVEIFERAPHCAATVASWQHVQLFSDWSLNMGEMGKTALASAGATLPDAAAFPSGREFIDGYLAPVAAALEAHPSCVGLRYGAEVLEVGRGALLKGESIGGGDLKMPRENPLCSTVRAQTPFRLLLRDSDGEERFAEGFDYVCDCSGVYGRKDLANWTGNGGLPALGERKLRTKDRLWTTIPDVMGENRARFAGRRTMVVGAGYSAATVVNFLLDLAKLESGTSVIWVTRRSQDAKPYEVIEEDVLPARKRLCILANEVCAGQAGEGISYVGGAAVDAISEGMDGRLTVTLQVHGDEGPRTEEVDELISCVGYRPDTSLFQELQVHQCYATDGPIKLAATLLGASGDCMAQTAAGVDVLKNPEPGFFILGSKSYGRNSAFLLKIGYGQAREVLEALAPAAAGAPAAPAA